MAINKSALAKAERIAAEEEARVAAYRAALVAPAKTQAQVDAINAGVRQVVESGGGIYNPETALTVENQVSINPAVATTENYSTGNRVNTMAIDAFDMIRAQLIQWGLGSLADTYISLAQKGYKADEALNKLKYDTSVNPATGKPWNAAYSVRFAGNAARQKQGLNVYDEREYLAIEDSYADTLRRNGLNNLLSADAEKNAATFAGYMAKGLSATEFADRIDEVTTRVTNLDPNIKKQFTTYYPGLSETDLISYVLAPENTLPVLKTKIAAAEIGASALQYGLGATSKGMAEDLARAGVTREEAQRGYEKIAEYLPRTQTLAQIYDETGIKYDQTTAEEEQLKGLASAKRKRQQIAELEESAFSGSSGRMRTGRPTGNTGQF
jgi:hypothetical protein